jgi:predicted Zn-dependent protease
VWGKNLTGARADLASLRAAALRVAPETIYEPAYTASYLQVAASSLEARIADAEGDLEKSADHWRVAVKAQDSLRYDEPPIWFYQVRQSLGSVLLRAGKLRDAEAILRESLRKQPRDGRVLFLLWKTLAAQKREREATLVEAQFRAAWKGPGMPRAEEL